MLHGDRALLGQVARFGLVGTVNTGVYYALYVVLQTVLPYLVAHVVAFAISVVGSFFLNCHFTYRVRPTWRKFFAFPLTTLTSFVLMTVGVVALVSGAGVDKHVAPLLAAVVAIPVTFVVTRFVLVR